jgi:nucleotide-binding universal stress UspA family protein
VELCEEGEKSAARDPVDDVARYLTRHRIKSDARVALSSKGTGADQLFNLALGEGADLIVAGAYGHSRLNEWILAG